MRLVVSSDRQEARNQALPERIGPLPDRMLDPDRRRTRVRLHRSDQLVGDEAQRDRLVEPEAGQERAGRVLDALARASRGPGERHGPVFGDVFVAVNPGDFLDQVDLAVEVASPARGLESGGLGRAAHRLQAERQQDPGDLARVDRDPQDPGDLVEPEGDRRPLDAEPARVDHAGVERSSRRLEDQLGAATAGPLGRLGVDRPFEPVARIAVEAEGPRSLPDVQGVEPRGLDQDVGRTRADLGLEPTHHAAQADRLRGIGDHEHVGGQLVGLAVDRLQGLALPSPTRDHGPPADLRQVVGVERLAALEHDVVGHVDDIADWSDAERLQPLTHPPGRLANFEVGDRPVR